MSENVIRPEEAISLPGLFRERVSRSPDRIAYRFYDAINETWADHTWREMAREVDRWQSALAKEKLEPGDRVAIMARNSRFWVMFDIAAMAMGLVVVPLYTEDRVDNAEYVMLDSTVKLLVIGGVAQWQRLHGRLDDVPSLKKIISIGAIENIKDKRMLNLADWLPMDSEKIEMPYIDKDALATIVYTSGTTGPPKGVMLSHHNMLSNAYGSLQTLPIEAGNVFLSFLPLSHTLERTIGYYLPMMAGATVAHNRSIPQLAEDLQVIKPTGFISVPRIFERVYGRVKESLIHQPAYRQTLFKLAVETGWRNFQYSQGRATWHPSLLMWPLLKRLVADKVKDRLGGCLKIAISGGAALAPEISKVFIGLGIPILQGYGLTEASPVVSVNRLENNIPASIGIALPGVEVRVDRDDELLVRGDNVMMGYWNNAEATAEVLDEEGWLHTGDKAKIEDKHIFITGRIKDIIVLATGEKISPTDMEMAIAADPLFEQVMIIGEAKPYFSVLAVLNKVQWEKLAEAKSFAKDASRDTQVEKFLLERLSTCLNDFPGYAKVRRITCTMDPWTVDDGLLTPTLKIKRKQVMEKYQEQIELMYDGHEF